MLTAVRTTSTLLKLPIGFAIGWISWVVNVVSWGAVANAIPGYLARFFPVFESEAAAKGLVLAVIGTLGIVNYRGIRPGAAITNFFTVAKILPLVIFVVIGVGTIA